MTKEGTAEWPVRIRSPRLVIRPPGDADRTALIRLMTDPVTREYLGGAVDYASRQALELSPLGITWGRWVLALAEDDTMIGSITLDYDRGELELSYALLPEWTGLGYAAESCIAAAGLGAPRARGRGRHRDQPDPQQARRRPLAQARVHGAQGARGVRHPAARCWSARCASRRPPRRRPCRPRRTRRPRRAAEGAALSDGDAQPRATGRLMRRGPPRPRPSSSPANSSTSTPWARR
ncbi:GNAT family N-acetyltransferase [Brachybacterium sp. GPGPB12]|uniref:GNAT family N-acetyltransferase n=1 Tax=Brachybacterium sp. GPGPB12 TaxID=3023517 RepID=UPI00313462E7